MKGRLNELWALLGAVNASIERGRGGGWGSGLLLMMRSWGRLRRWVFFRSSVFLRLIEVVAFLDPIIAHDSEGSEAEK